jgi:hypothetical protein
MLTLPRNIQAQLLAAPGHAYNLHVPGELSTGASGDFSTGGNWGIFNRH